MLVLFQLDFPVLFTIKCKRYIEENEASETPLKKFLLFLLWLIIKGPSFSFVMFVCLTLYIVKLTHLTKRRRRRGGTAMISILKDERE